MSTTSSKLNNQTTNAPRKGVAGIIAGLNRKSQTPQAPTTVTMNPLMMKQTKSMQAKEDKMNIENKVNTPPKSTNKIASPKASQINYSTVVDKNLSSPKAYNSRIQAGSPLRQPRSPNQHRSPLSPKDVSSLSSHSHSVTSPLRKNVNSLKRPPQRALPPLDKSIRSITKSIEENIQRNNETEEKTPRNSAPFPSSPRRISQLQTLFSSPPSAQSPSKLSNQKTIRNGGILNIRPNPNPNTSSNPNPNPNSQMEEVAPADSTPSSSSSTMSFDSSGVVRKTVDIHQSYSLSTSALKSSQQPTGDDHSADFAILFDKIQKQSKRQFEMALYQMIELFTKNQQYRRNPIVLHAILSFKPFQLVQFLLEYLSPNRALDDRRNVADTLSSLLSLHLKFPREIAAISELLRAHHAIAVFIDCMKDDDWLLRSYTVGILATLNIDPLTYSSLTEAAASSTDTSSLSTGNSTPRDSFSASSNPLFAIHSSSSSSSSSSTPINPHRAHPSTSSSSLSCGQTNGDWTNGKEAIEKIKALLESKSAEVREMAMSSMICLGPLAGSLLPDLAEILLRDKSSTLRILACKTIEEIGLPYCLPMMDILNEVVKKDKDDNVRKFALRVYENLFLKNSQFPIPSLSLSRPEKKIVINKAFLKDLFVKNNANGSGNTFKGLTFADIAKYVEKQYPNIDKENPSWRSQLKITIKRMIEESSASKTPAVYSFSF